MMQADLPLALTQPWLQALAPTRAAALERVARVRPAAYARTRNHLEGDATGLSPYLTHGLVTLREVLAGALQRGPLEVQHKLVYELGWREYFRHVWAQRGEGILQSLHAGPRPETGYEPVVPPDIREARTGVPAIDQAVRTLYATGTLHNHARMWLASYVVHLRRVHWRAGADWLVAHLLDGDLASNHLSWQWVAGTGSHKPYLFNAENVARFAPASWHSRGSVVDQPYEALDRIARGQNDGARPEVPTWQGDHAPTPEPALLTTPPADLGLHAPGPEATDALRGREVWLVHPWALRPPPADLPAGAQVIGFYPQEHHARWPWPAERWRWVDAAMAAVAPQRWFVGTAALQAALQGAARVRSIGDPHAAPWLPPMTELASSPALFPPVDRDCTSFSQWWTRATKGLHLAEELL